MRNSAIDHISFLLNKLLKIDKGFGFKSGINVFNTILDTKLNFVEFLRASALRSRGHKIGERTIKEPTRR